jgi:hypothetical protein
VAPAGGGDADDVVVLSLPWSGGEGEGTPPGGGLGLGEDGGVDGLPDVGEGGLLIGDGLGGGSAGGGDVLPDGGGDGDGRGEVGFIRLFKSCRR